MTETTRRVLLERVPDEPAQTDVRAALLARDVRIWPADADAYGHGVYAPSLELACIVGVPPPSALASLAHDVVRGCQVVCELEQSDAVAAALPHVLSEAATFFALPEAANERLPAPDDVRIVTSPSDVPLAHLPDGLRTEMEGALAHTFVAMALASGKPASFCYPHHQTEGHWDVSVDTIESHRRQGLAGRAFAGAFAHLAAQGKRPVWGALASNEASVHMAQRLGFEPIATRQLLIAAGCAGR